MTDSSSTGPTSVFNPPTEAPRTTKARAPWTSADIKHNILLRHGDWLAAHDAEVRAEGEAIGYLRGHIAGIHIGLGLPASPAGPHADRQVHAGVPLQFVQALQRGPFPPYDNPMDAPTVEIGGHSVTVTVTDKGTGIPEPETAAAWKGLCSVVEEVVAASEAGYISNHVRVLPPQISVAIWTDHAGRTVRVQAAGTPRS